MFVLEYTRRIQITKREAINTVALARINIWRRRLSHQILAI